MNEWMLTGEQYAALKLFRNTLLYKGDRITIEEMETGLDFLRHQGVPKKVRGKIREKVLQVCTLLIAEQQCGNYRLNSKAAIS